MNVPVKTHLSPALARSTISERRITSSLDPKLARTRNKAARDERAGHSTLHAIRTRSSTTTLCVFTRGAEASPDQFPSQETQQVPILALASQAFNESFAAETCCSEAVTFTDPLSVTSHHHPILLHTIAGALSASLGEEVLPTQIHDFELSLFDTQLSTIGGALVRRFFLSLRA